LLRCIARELHAAINEGDPGPDAADGMFERIRARRGLDQPSRRSCRCLISPRALVKRRSLSDGR
jgi:hypothetical protein